MKHAKLFILSLTSFLLVGCGNTDTTPVYEVGDKKVVQGSGLLFEETIGFNTKDATVFEENGERYYIYASNETSRGEQVFAARKATFKDGETTYSKKNIILRGSESWDKYIYQPSVVKGTFKYNDADYKYLMAYQGNNIKGNNNNHIGLAVSNDILGEWTRVGNAPLLKNEDIYSSSFGYGSPNLVSYDKKGNLCLSYSFGETQLSGTRVVDIDATNLNNVKVSGYSELPNAGLVGREDQIVTNIGFTFTEDYSKVFIANDGMPSSNAPGSAASFEVATAGNEIISSHSATWTSVQRVTGFDTVIEEDEESLGWDELYSPCFVTNEYGLVKTDANELEVIYSTFEEGKEYSNYSASLCSFKVSLNA